MSLSRFFCTLPLLLFALNSSAKPSIYTIEGKFEAVFPGKPEFFGEIGEGQAQQSVYSYTDEVNKIIITTYYTVARNIVPNNVINSCIKGVINGKAIAMNGTISYQDIGTIGSDYGGKFTINYKYHEVPARNNGAIIYRDGHLYQWSVTDIPFTSTTDGSIFFNNYVKYFRIK